jgi:hypothetical protein
MRKYFFSLFLITSFIQFANAQSDNSLKETPWLSRSRFYLGGTGGLSFGSVTYVEIAPLVGYRVTDRFSFGVNPKYSFIHFKPTYNSQDYKTHIIGGSFFVRYFILDNIFLTGEYEVNNYPVLVTLPNNGGIKEQRMFIESLLIGGGYMQKLGDVSGIYIQVLYDVLQNPYSPYYRIPVIRAGVMFGL